MPGIENNKQGIKIMVFLLFAFLVYYLFESYREGQVNKHGVYYKCIILKKDSRKGGKIITIEYFILNIKKTGYLTRDYPVEIELNKQYFIKATPGESDMIIFLYDKQVPDCLLNVVPPKEGWKELPKCEE
jgi:hypothetical protein